MQLASRIAQRYVGQFTGPLSDHDRLGLLSDAVRANSVDALSMLLTLEVSRPRQRWLERHAVELIESAFASDAAESVCVRDKRWWMWEDQAGFLPTEDETAWNEMVVYLRRNGPRSGTKGQGMAQRAKEWHIGREAHGIRPFPGQRRQCRIMPA